MPQADPIRLSTVDHETRHKMMLARRELRHFPASARIDKDVPMRAMEVAHSTPSVGMDERKSGFTKLKPEAVLFGDKWPADTE